MIVRLLLRKQQGCESVDDLPLVGTEAAPNSQQNYANWYTYYRKRDYVAKRALSEVFDQATARLGLATLHNHDSVGTEIKDVDNITTPVTNADASSNKLRLMDNLFQIDPGNRTPLRQTLERAGNYFQEGVSTGVSTLFGSSALDDFNDYESAGTVEHSPILSVDNGGSCQKNFTVLLSDGFLE